MINTNVDSDFVKKSVRKYDPANEVGSYFGKGQRFIRIYLLIWVLPQGCGFHERGTLKRLVGQLSRIVSKDIVSTYCGG